MPYPIPDRGFDALEHATNKVTRANQLQELILQQYINASEDFWGVTSPPAGSRYTVEQMQAVLDAMPHAVALDLLSVSREFATFITSSYPDALSDRYRDSAFTLAFSAGRITVGELKLIWQAPAPDVEALPEEPVVTEAP